jgi:hypothetical protein
VVRRRLVAVVPAVAVLVAAGAFWLLAQAPIEVRRADVVSVRTQPIPEGPTAAPFERQATSAYSRPLSLIEEAIPVPLPGRGVQPPWCRVGADLIITLADGRTITYGPCYRPAPIEALWQRIGAAGQAP